jgi:hypothetical protein
MNQQEYRKWKNLQEKKYQKFKYDIEQRWGEFIESQENAGFTMVKTETPGE